MIKHCEAHPRLIGTARVSCRAPCRPQIVVWASVFVLARSCEPLSWELVRRAAIRTS